MIRFVLSLLSLTTIALAEVQINFPSDWISQPIPSELPESIRFIKKVSSPDQTSELTVAEFAPVKDLSGAQEAVDGQISGMNKSNFKLDNIEDTTIDGYTAKHISGAFYLDGYDGFYYSHCFLIFTDETSIMVGVSSYHADGLKPAPPIVTDWITIPGSPIQLSTHPQVDQQNKNFSMAFYVGKYGFYAIVIWGVVGVIRKRHLKEK